MVTAESAAGPADTTSGPAAIAVGTAGTDAGTAGGGARAAGRAAGPAVTAAVTAESAAGPADTTSGPAAIAVGTAGTDAGTAGGGARAAGRAAGPAETAVVTAESAAGPAGTVSGPAESAAGPAGTVSGPAESAAATGARTTGEGAAAVRGGHGVNHDKSFRPRRQDRPQDFLETGAAYAMDAAGLRAHGHRFFGRTALVRTDPARVLEVDDPHDLARARALAPLLDAGRTGLPTADDIDAVVLDFDGTQTDDRVLIDADGREFVSVHRGDGLGVAALRRGGLKLLILSTEQNPVVAARARKLRIPVLHGVDRKDLALKQWCEEQGIAPERVLYVGNDVNDLPCFALVGWPVAVASAHDAVRGAARAVTTVPGGAGAVREIAGWILGPSLDSLPQ
ncbi:HAD hydrolase family protein [Streptomyces althioticus]|uniref:HAD hydrolase family protein n=1 Tax=Streptomyces althioticus TaxID=83380 RepID=UPI00369B9342